MHVDTVLLQYHVHSFDTHIVVNLFIYVLPLHLYIFITFSLCTTSFYPCGIHTAFLGYSRQYYLLSVKMFSLINLLC